MTAAKVTPLLPPARIDRSACNREARLAVREWRCAKGWPQDRAARYLGIDARTLRAYENGECAVPGWVLVAIGVAVRDRKAAA